MRILHDDERPERLRRLLDRACVMLAYKRPAGSDMPTVPVRVDDLIRTFDALEDAGVDPKVLRFP